MKKELVNPAAVFLFLVLVSSGLARTLRQDTIPSIPTPRTTASTSTIQWGAFTGGSIASLSAFTQLVGKQPNVVAVFIGDGASFLQRFSSFYGLGDANQTLLVYWESNMTSAQIAAGMADSFVKEWAKDIKAYGHPVILSVLDEMNDSEPHYTGDPANYKAAWLRVHDIFTTVPNVKFAYVVNNDSSPQVPSNSLTSYYPGDAYVDIVGVDGFNGYLAWGGPPKTWSQVFINNQNAAIPTLMAAFPDKPLWIMSTGSCQGPGKQQFIADMGAGIKQYGVSGWIWFNVNKECDWRVDTDSNSLRSFKALIQ